MAQAHTNGSTWTIKNVKSFRGHDGGGFNASLYRNNKRVALVDDDGWGGGWSFTWLDMEGPKVDAKVHTMQGEVATIKATVEESILLAEIFNEVFSDDYGSRIWMSCELFVEPLVEAYENNKWLKRHCLTMTLFRLKGDEGSDYRTVEVPYSPRVKAFLDKKYGDSIREIVNERFTKVA